MEEHSTSDERLRHIRKINMDSFGASRSRNVAGRPAGSRFYKRQWPTSPHGHDWQVGRSTPEVKDGKKKDRTKASAIFVSHLYMEQERWRMRIFAFVPRTETALISG